MLTKLPVVIILQYIYIPNQYVVYLKLIQCCISFIYQYNWKKIKLNNRRMMRKTVSQNQEIINTKNVYKVH